MKVGTEMFVHPSEVEKVSEHGNLVLRNVSERNICKRFSQQNFELLR